MQSSTFYGAFSVGYSQRPKWYINKNKDVPSPIYNPSFKNKPTSPKYKIGKGDRSSIIDQRKIPGPGDYEDNTGKQNFVKGVKLLGKNIIEPTFDDVSPTKYNPKTKIVYKTQPSFSFTMRQGEVWAKDTPGPNHYFQESQTFDKFVRSTSQTKQGVSSMNDIDQSMTSTKKHRKSVDVTANTTQNRGFTMTEKLKFVDKKIPGVGMYEIENSEARVKTPAFTFEKTKRSLSNVETMSPGPGAFHTPLERSQANRFSMGTSERVSQAFAVKNVNPGPGAYEPKQIQKNLGFSIGHPSANHYDDRDYDEKSREDRKRRERIDEILKQRRIPIPGPQDYQEVYTLDRKVLQMRLQTPQIQDVGEIQRAYLSINENPGPGDYESNYFKTRRQSPSYHIQERPKTQRKEIEENPGPGEYDPADTFSKTQGPFFKIGRGQRSNPVRNKYKVGPGSYLVNRDERGNSYTIGTESRFNYKGQQKPGPGQYNISGDIGRLPSYMLKRKQQKQDDSINQTFNEYSETQSQVQSQLQEARFKKNGAPKNQNSLTQSETKSVVQSQPDSPVKSQQNSVLVQSILKNK